MSRILVTGGTGTLGRLVIPRLKESGHDVRVLSRTPRANADGVEHVVGDLATGADVEAAVAGVGTILHLAGTSTGDDAKAQHLVDAARATGTEPHLVYISVVGADRMQVRTALDRRMFGYFASKRAAEVVVERSGLPWTTLRATQFYELVLLVARSLTKLPVVPVPSGQAQPVAAEDVADRLVELALGAPSGLVPDVAGPTVYTARELVSSYLDATGKRRPILPVRLPGGAARAFASGANLAPDRAVGKVTWEQFLARAVR